MSAFKNLYKKSKKGSEEVEDLLNMFSKAPIEVEKIDQEDVEDLNEIIDIEQQELLDDIKEDNEEKQQDKENPFINEELSVLQKKERDERTVFIGNVPIDATKKEVIKVFKQFGKIENIRERSVPVKQSKDLSVKARVILKRHVEVSDKQPGQVKNCYILFVNKEDAEKALDKNGFEFKGNYLRVDIAVQQELDYTKTIFVGNLSFLASENQLREHFTQCGPIVNVRIIRDKTTHQGKGFGYVQFKNNDGYQASLELKGSKMAGRELRIKKAVPQQRLEKKRLRKEEKQKQNADFALRRIKDKMKGEMEVENPQKGGKKNFKPDNFLSKNNLKTAKQFTENKMENIDDVDIQNKIVVPPRMIRRSIKKSKQRGEDSAEQKFKNVQRMQKKFHAKNDKNIFNGEQGLKDLKEKRKKKSELNKKKAKNQIIHD